jgi:hypothetical protein
MKKLLVCMLAMCALAQTGLTETGKQNAAWATNWSAFVAELSTHVAQHYNFVSNVNNTFDGKVVTWTGKFIETKLLEKGNLRLRLVRIAMKPENLMLASGSTALTSGSTTLDSLALKPDASEWRTWEAVSVGDTVNFTTTLEKSGIPNKCVLNTMEYNNAGTWELRAWVNTKGGTCLKSQRAAKD